MLMTTTILDKIKTTMLKIQFSPRANENHSKSSSEGFKINPKSGSKAIVLQKMPSNIIFFEKLQVLTIFGLPNAPKIKGKALQIR